MTFQVLVYDVNGGEYQYDLDQASFEERSMLIRNLSRDPMVAQLFIQDERGLEWVDQTKYIIGSD